MCKDDRVESGSTDEVVEVLYANVMASMNDPAGYYREESKIMLKPLLVGFYNLHIQVPDYDRSQVKHKDFDYTEAPFPDDVEKIPDEEEQLRITEFFAEHCTTAKSALEYIERKGRNWFAEEGFIRFADDYHYTKNLIDVYIDTRAWEESFGDVDSIDWLKSRLGVRIQEPVSEMADQSFRIEWEQRTTEDTEDKNYYYGPQEIFVFMSNIFEALRRMGKDQWKLGGCNLERCDNIFMIGGPGKPRKYCSETHRVRAYQLRKAAKPK